MLTCGIDVGSITTKAAIMEEGRLLAEQLIFTGYNAEKAARQIFHDILLKAGRKETAIDRIVSTGYGRRSAPMAHKTFTEIMCHAAGARWLDQSVRSVIDVGGQDSKAILLDNQGKVKNFAMNDKCAAGTGRFLEVMARALELDLEEFGTLSLQAEAPASISSLCTVFAESEVISLISRGEDRKNIIAGIHKSISDRIMALALRVNVTEPIMMTGGVAKNAGVVKSLERSLRMTIIVSDHAQVNGAIGAAILAGDI